MPLKKVISGLVQVPSPLAGSGIMSLVEDTSPQLGGDLDLNGHVITGMEIGAEIQAHATALDDWATIVPGVAVGDALAEDIGDAGAVVVLGGAGGTPSSITLTNATGLPPSGVTGTAAILGANTFTGAQTIGAASAASAPAEILTGAWYAAGTGTTTLPHVLLQATGTTASTSWSTAGTGIGVNAVSGFTGNLIDAKVGGTTTFSVAAAGTITTATSVILGSGSHQLTWSGKSRMFSPSDGVIELLNQASNDFGRLQFGGTTSSFPALKRSTTSLEVKLADDSAYTNLSALTVDLGGNTDTTLTRASAGNVAVEGNLVYRAGGTDVPVTDGGTGLSSLGSALQVLRVNAGATALEYADPSAGSFTATDITGATDIDAVASGDSIVLYDTSATGLKEATFTQILAWIDASNHTFTGTVDMDAATVTLGTLSNFTLPSAAGTATLATAGAMSLNTTDKQIGIHNGAREVAIPLIQHRTWSFDPKAVCDGAVDRLFLMSLGTGEPFGITVTGWKLSFEADPTTEVDLDLKRADAFIGVANSAVMDVLDTTAGASSEATAANINSGAVVANGKVLYLEFGTAYTETTHQIIFEMWYEIEED